MRPSLAMSIKNVGGAYSSADLTWQQGKAQQDRKFSWVLDMYRKGYTMLFRWFIVSLAPWGIALALPFANAWCCNPTVPKKLSGSPCRSCGVIKGVENLPFVEGRPVWSSYKQQQMLLHAILTPLKGFRVRFIKQETKRSVSDLSCETFYHKSLYQMFWKYRERNCMPASGSRQNLPVPTSGKWKWWHARSDSPELLLDVSCLEAYIRRPPPADEDVFWRVLKLQKCEAWTQGKSV